MKKILLLFLTLGLLSGCSLNDDDNPESDLLYAYAPITAVEFPETFMVGETYSIKITYTLPSPCHRLFGYEHVPDGDEHLFGIVTTYHPEDPACTDTPGESKEFLWEFTVNQMNLHIFKFWTGVDANEEPTFITREVEVTEPNT